MLTNTPEPTHSPAPTPTQRDFTFSIHGSAFGATLNPVNDTAPGEARDDEADVDLGPLSIRSDNANTWCTDSKIGFPVVATCTSSLENFLLSLDGVVIVTAESLVAQSNSTNDGVTKSSDDDGTHFAGLCIQQTLGVPCTELLDAAQGSYDIDLDGGAHGTISVKTETPSTSEGAATGNGLTVTMLHVDLQTNDGQIVLDIVQAHTFVSGDSIKTPTPAPALTPPAAPTLTPTPTPAQLPNSGGWPSSGSASYSWFIALIGLVICAGVLAAGLRIGHSTRDRASDVWPGGEAAKHD